MNPKILWINEQNQKRCSTCKKYKFLNEFHNDKTGIAQKAYSCKVCALARSSIRHNERVKNDVEYKKKKNNSYIKSAHGISRDKYIEIRTKQGKCAICLTTNNIENFHYDHNHKTGKYREFLCSNCNRGIGHLQEDEIILKNAIKYLNKHKD